VELLGKATTLRPDLVEAWRALAFVYLETARPAEALAATEKTLALVPTDPEALRNRYDSLTALGRKEEASAALDALVANVKTPDTARLLFNRGVDAMKIPDAATARTSFQQALAVDPNLHQAHSALAEMAIGDKDYAVALAELEKVLALAPRNFKAWERKIEVLKALGKTKEAADEEKKLAAAKAAPAS
jgi:tetratricopeptide (TPR) repeat protein